MLVGSIAFMGTGEVMACTSGEDCSGVSCPLPVAVELPPEAMPPDAIPRICVDDVCSEQLEHVVVNAFGWLGPLSGDEHVDVRLELVDADDVVLRTFEGSGSLRGDCCASLLLRISDDGESLVEVEG